MNPLEFNTVGRLNILASEISKKKGKQEKKMTKLQHNLNSAAFSINNSLNVTSEEISNLLSLR